MGSSLQGSAGRSSRALGVAMGIVAGVSFGFGGAISQILGRQGFTVFDIATAQFFCAVVILGVLTLFTRRAHFAPKEVAMLIGLGAVSTISSITYYLAIDLLSVATAVAIQFQYVWMTIVLQLVVEKKKPSKRIIVIVTLVVVGTLFGSGLADEVLSGGLTADPLGIACALVCALFYALFIFANGRVAPDQPPIARTFVLVIGGFIVTSAIGWNFYTQPDLVVSLLPGGVVMAVVMSILPVLCIVGASLRLPSGSADLDRAAGGSSGWRAAAWRDCDTIGHRWRGDDLGWRRLIGGAGQRGRKRRRGCHGSSFRSLSLRRARLVDACCRASIVGKAAGFGGKLAAYEHLAQQQIAYCQSCSHDAHRFKRQLEPPGGCQQKQHGCYGQRAHGAPRRFRELLGSAHGEGGWHRAPLQGASAQGAVVELAREPHAAFIASAHGRPFPCVRCSSGAACQRGASRGGGGSPGARPG